MNLIQYNKIYKEAKDYKSTIRVMIKYMDFMTFKQFERLLYKLKRYDNSI